MREHVPLELYIVFTEYERTLRINYNAIGPPPLGNVNVTVCWIQAPRILSLGNPEPRNPELQESWASGILSFKNPELRNPEPQESWASGILNPQERILSLRNPELQESWASVESWRNPEPRILSFVSLLRESWASESWILNKFVSSRESWILSLTARVALSGTPSGRHQSTRLVNSHANVR